MTTANISLERYATVLGTELVHVMADGSLIGTIHNRNGSYTVDYPDQPAFKAENAAIAFLVDLFNRVVKAVDERDLAAKN